MEEFKNRQSATARLNMALGALHQVATVAIVAIIVFADIAMAFVVINGFGSRSHMDMLAAACVFCGHIFLPIPLLPFRGQDESRGKTSTGFPKREIFDVRGKTPGGQISRWPLPSHHRR